MSGKTCVFVCKSSRPIIDLMTCDCVLKLTPIHFVLYRAMMQQLIMSKYVAFVFKLKFPFFNYIKGALLERNVNKIVYPGSDVIVARVMYCG